MPLPATLLKPTAWQIVWDSQNLDFLFKSLPSPHGAVEAYSGSAPDGVIEISLGQMSQMAEEAREKAREDARQAHRTEMLQDFTKYRHKIKSLQWPPTPAQHRDLFDLQQKLGRQDPIRIFRDQGHKTTPEQGSAAMSEDQGKKTTGIHAKEQPYLAISTEFDLKVRPARFFLYRPEARQASICPDGYAVYCTLTDFFEIFKETTAKEAKKLRQKQRKNGNAQATSSRSVSGSNIGTANEDTVANNTKTSGTKVPRFVYIIGRLVICQPHTADKGNRDWVEPTVFVVAVDLDKRIDNCFSTGNSNIDVNDNDNDDSSSCPVWLLRDNEPASLDASEDLWELQNADLSMRRLSAIWPMMEGKEAFGAARLVNSVEGILDSEACISLSEAGANVLDSMDMGSWAMVGIQDNQAWPSA